MEVIDDSFIGINIYQWRNGGQEGNSDRIKGEKSRRREFGLNERNGFGNDNFSHGFELLWSKEMIGSYSIVLD